MTYKGTEYHSDKKDIRNMEDFDDEDSNTFKLNSKHKSKFKILKPINQKEDKNGSQM